jgi:hypothetical protein
MLVLLPLVAPPSVILSEILYINLVDIFVAFEFQKLTPVPFIRTYTV